jgi:hypothetical protein
MPHGTMICVPDGSKMLKCVWAWNVALMKAWHSSRLSIFWPWPPVDVSPSGNVLTPISSPG